MYVKFGKYKDWFGPYQLAEKLCFWAKDEEDEYGFKSKPQWVHEFGEWLAHGSVESDRKRHKMFGGKERPTTLLYKFLLWLDSLKERKLEVRIDPWDTWGMYHSLALIIHPMLLQLKEKSHGSQTVDDEDVPEGLGLRSTEAPPCDEGEIDDNVHKRWEWVLNEMIWAFEQILDENAESQFHTGTSDVESIPVDKDHNEVLEDDTETEIKFWECRRTDKDTSVFDKEGWQDWNERIERGTTLFGKYFRGLWD